MQQRLYNCYLDCIRQRNVRHRLEEWLKEQGIALDSDETAHAIAPAAVIEGTTAAQLRHS